MRKPVIFVAGIIQGSSPDGVEDQGYRNEIISILQEALPDVDIFNPVEKYPNSLTYDYETGKEAFFDLMSRSALADMVIAYIPSASMGTAIEVWNAYHAGAPVVAISPLGANWVLRFLADQICPDMESFKKYAASGELAELLKATFRG